MPAATTVTSKAAPGRREIGIVAARVFVRAEPRADSPEIGVVRLGAALAERPEPARAGEGCSGAYHAVEPVGWVCVAPEVATLQPETHPALVARRAHPTDLDRDAPFTWGESRGAPVVRWLSGSHGGALAPDADTRHRVGRVPARSSVAWIAEVARSGRTWLVTPELTAVAADRVVQQPPSLFRGVPLEGEVRLPLAFVRAEEAGTYRLVDTEAGGTHPVALSSAPESPELVEVPRGAPGRLEPTGKSLSRLAAAALTGRVRRQRGERYLETRGDGAWLRERDVTIATEEPPRGLALRPGERWLDVSIHRGTLVAYEGSRAVFATLISPGLFGYRRVDGKPARYTTPTGAFRIEWKHRSTTMTPDPERMSYFLAEVPWTQFFHMPYALHAAYWHDRFGEPRSGGCVNLSVADARWLFSWTSPAVPEGWHGVRAGGGRGDGTWVRVR